MANRDEMQYRKPVDKLGRPLHDLRISVTDKCNFRCRYCMPREVFGPDFSFLAHQDVLSFEEIARVAQLVAQLGVRKLRLTGGEPLMRRNLPVLVEQLARIDGIEDIALTTNGSLLTMDVAQRLRAAGLHRITVSLDALDDAIFMAMNDAAVPVARVLDGLANAQAAGFSPLKINMVVKRGVNEDQILPMADYFRGTPHILRFIEYMDVGHSNGWRLQDVVPARDILATIATRWPAVPCAPQYVGEVAARYRYEDGAGEFGLITSVTRPFCGACSRLRMTADGKLFTCLFGNYGFDIRARLRDGATDDEVANDLRAMWMARTDRYSELRTEATPDVRRVEMSQIGG